MQHPTLIKRPLLDTGKQRFTGFSVDEYETSWSRVRTASGRINAVVEPLLDEIRRLEQGPPDLTSSEFPFVLSAGERRAYTANTVLRNHAWRKKDPSGALRINPEDAARLALNDGAAATVETPNGRASVVVEISERMQPGVANEHETDTMR